MSESEKDTTINDDLSRIEEEEDEQREDSSREYFFGITLSKSEPSVTWPEKPAEDDDDPDYVEHTLFFRNATLGLDAKEGERNVVSLQTKAFDNKVIDQPILSLTLGRNEMCGLDLNASSFISITLKLVAGSGPVHITGQHVIDLPDTDLDETMPDDDDNKENDVTKEEQDDSRDDTTDVKKIPPEDIKKKKTGQDETKKSVKRKAPLKEKENKKARKQGKMSTSEADEDESMDEDEDEAESSPEKKRTKKIAKPKISNEKLSVERTQKASASDKKKKRRTSK